MKALPTILFIFGVLFVNGPTVNVRAQAPTEGIKVEGGKDAGITIWILAYERKDANAAADKVFLPGKIKPALEKLKDKGAKKMQFNFQYRQLYVWLEGSKVATVEDIRGAFPGLELKPIASAQFAEEAGK